MLVRIPRLHLHVTEKVLQAMNDAQVMGAELALIGLEGVVL